MRKPRTDWWIFWPAVLVIFCVVAVLTGYPAASSEIGGRILTDIAYFCGAFAQWVVLLGTGWLIWLAMSRYGNVKLGGFEDKPEFSDAGWISYLFTAGISMTLLILASIDPIRHIGSTYLDVSPYSRQAIDLSVAFSMFHWGFAGWGLYSITGVAIAYSYHVRRVPYLKGSVACAGVLGSLVNGWLGKAIDLTIVLALVGGLGASQGLNVPVLSAILVEIFGIESSPALAGLVIIIFTVLAAYTVYLGLHQGMEKLAEIRVWASIALALFVLILGPTGFLLSFFGKSLGLMFQNYLAMSTHTVPFDPGAAAADWTIFYWAWWGAYSIYMGLFIARISKGRTIRQMVMGSLIIPSLICFFILMVFGGYSVYLQETGPTDLVRLLREQGNGALLVYILKSLPFHQVILPLYFITGIISMATPYQGMAFGLASIATEKLYAGEDPAVWQRIFWVLVNGCFGFAIVMLNNMDIVLLSAVISLVPMLAIIILMVLSFMRHIRADLAASQAGDRVIISTQEQKGEAKARL